LKVLDRTDFTQGGDSDVVVKFDIPESSTVLPAYLGGTDLMLREPVQIIMQTISKGSKLYVIRSYFGNNTEAMQKASAITGAKR
jgi:hypothetical protein